MRTRLFINYYKDSNPERQAELDYCLKMNLNNPLIDKVYALCEFDVPGCETVHFEGRPTLADFFRIANETAEEGDVSIISNTDIYFNETLSHLYGMDADECYALSRWDDTPTGIRPFHYWDSQDAWIFKGPIREVKSDFCMGIPGIDNRIAYEIRKAGYKLSNPCQSIYAFHRHNSGIRHYTSTTAAVPRPYVLVSPTRIGYPSALHKVE